MTSLGDLFSAFPRINHEEMSSTIQTPQPDAISEILRVQHEMLRLAQLNQYILLAILAVFVFVALTSNTPSAL